MVPGENINNNDEESVLSSDKEKDNSGACICRVSVNNIAHVVVLV